MIGPIKTVSVYVEDQDKALEFYTTKLGFQVRRKLPMGPNTSWLEVSPPDAQSSLVLYPKAMMPDWEQVKISVVFHCPDVEITCRNLEAKGVQIKMQPKSMPWGMFATFVDPTETSSGLPRRNWSNAEREFLNCWRP